MTVEELHKFIREGELIFMDDLQYKSEVTRVLSGYTRYGNEIYQISRSIFNFNFRISDIQITMPTSDPELGYFLLIEIRGIKLYEDRLINSKSNYINDIVSSIYKYYDPDIKYTPNKIFRVIKNYFIEEGYNDLSVLDDIKKNIFVHYGESLGIKMGFFNEVDFIKVFEDYMKYMSDKVMEYEFKDNVMDHVLEGYPIYRSKVSEEDDEDDTDMNSEKDIEGFYYDEELDKIIQFTRVVDDGYKCRIEYYYYDNNGSVSVIARINDISIQDKDEYKVEVLDKNYRSMINEIRDGESSDKDSTFIKLLFSGLDEEFFIRNWEKVEIDRNPSEEGIESYDKYEFVDSILPFLKPCKP